MASLYKLPCIFVVENNKWAIGMNHPRATGVTYGDDEPFIYKKGPAFGMPGVLVDGMDVRKVRLPAWDLLSNLPSRPFKQPAGAGGVFACAVAGGPSWQALGSGGRHGCQEGDSWL